jgi:ArsR family transcriptional regulator
MVDSGLADGEHESTPGPASGCCTTIRAVDDRELAADVRTLAALGNDTRYEAVRLIAQAEDGICVCDLESALGVSQGAVSQALSRLFDSGLLDRRKEGRWRYYTATERADRLLAALDAIRELDDDE